MPNRRSKRKQAQQFFCPNCNQRLWRLGGPKNQVDVCNHANLLAARSKSYISVQYTGQVPSSPHNILTDNWLELAWTEEFACEKHGTMRMLVTRKTDGTLAAVPAKKRNSTPRIETLKAPKIQARR